MSEETNTSEWPTKEFFESNAKAEDIRQACIPILEKIHRLFYDPQIVDDADRQFELYAELETDNVALLELGIKEDMMHGKRKKEYRDNPLVMAQYLAGQLMQMTGKNLSSESEAVAAIGEFSKSQDDNVPVVESDQILPRARSFIVNRHAFNLIMDGFAIDNSELGLPKEY